MSAAKEKELSLVSYGFCVSVSRFISTSIGLLSMVKHPDHADNAKKAMKLMVEARTALGLEQ